MKQLHVFDSRTEAFGGDGVLQENVIFRAIARESPPATVRTTSSSGTPDCATTILDVPYECVVPATSEHPAIHLITDRIALGVAERMETFSSSLARLGLTVSTGRVVDFRAKPHLRAEPDDTTVPLIYPSHLRRGGVRWPVEGSRKPNAIALDRETERLLVPGGTYLLTKRFSSKEQRRRIDAFLYTEAMAEAGPVGFENHVNYIHQDGHGLEMLVAKGLFIYLNSTLVDLYFRLFSGHTQVNATDLRSLPFPDADALSSAGADVSSLELDQDEVDIIFNRRLLTMANERAGDPVASIKRVEEARGVLKALGFPRKQTNVRSALVLLSLLELRRDTPWAQAAPASRGITEMMRWFGEHYGKVYAPNSRETVRRNTVHQFIDAGLVELNPDDPGRAVNSQDNRYRVVPEAVDALRSYATPGWNDALTAYLAQMPTLAARYAQRREMKRIPVRLDDGTELSLSPGVHNELGPGESQTSWRAG